VIVIDATKKQSQRAAYEAYARLYWRSVRLASGDPERAALAEATRRAEVQWRALMRPDRDRVMAARDAVSVSSPTTLGTAALVPEELLVSAYGSVSLSVWGD